MNYKSTPVAVSWNPTTNKKKAVFISACCEEGHKWSLVIQFHKGYQFLYAVNHHPTLDGWK